MTIYTPFGGEYISTQTPASLTLDAPPEKSFEETQQAVEGDWAVPSGQIMVLRDRVKTSWDDAGLIEATHDRVELMQQFEPWATVLLVGGPYKTEYGTTIDPPDVKPGQRVLIKATGGDNVELEAGGQKMTVTLIGFRGIALIQKLKGAE